MAQLTVNHCWILDMARLLRTGAIVPGVAKTEMRFELDGIPGYSSYLRYVRINSWYPSRGDAGMQVFFPDGSTDIINFRCVPRGVAKTWLFAVAEGEHKIVLARKLYRPPLAFQFDTRKAHNLPYPERNLSKYDRIVNRIRKLRASLHFTPDICGPFGPKPPNMRRSSFRRKRQKLKELELLRLANLPRTRGRPPKFSRLLRLLETPLSGIPLSPAESRRRLVVDLLVDRFHGDPFALQMILGYPGRKRASGDAKIDRKSAGSDRANRASYVEKS